MWFIIYQLVIVFVAGAYFFVLDILMSRPGL